MENDPERPQMHLGNQLSPPRLACPDLVTRFSLLKVSRLRILQTIVPPIRFNVETMRGGCHFRYVALANQSKRLLDGKESQETAHRKRPDRPESHTANRFNPAPIQPLPRDPLSHPCNPLILIHVSHLSNWVRVSIRRDATRELQEQE